MKILVGIPIHRPVEMQVFSSFLALASVRSENTYEFKQISNSLVYDGREWIAEEFMKGDYSHLMFIDSDMTFHPHSIEMLLKHNLDFVTAKAFKRVKPYQPCFYTKVSYEKNEPTLESPLAYGQGLLEIQGCGLACALISRKVFEEIPRPYFFPYPNLGEDLTFSLKVREAGFKMYCDTTLQFGHVTPVEIFEQHFFNEYKEEREKAGIKP